MRESRVRNPAFLRVSLKDSSAFTRARASPCELPRLVRYFHHPVHLHGQHIHLFVLRALWVVLLPVYGQTGRNTRQSVFIYDETVFTAGIIRTACDGCFRLLFPKIVLLPYILFYTPFASLGLLIFQFSL